MRSQLRSLRRGATPKLCQGGGRLQDFMWGLGIQADVGRPPGRCTFKDQVRRVLRGARAARQAVPQVQSVRTAWSDRR